MNTLQAWFNSTMKAQVTPELLLSKLVRTKFERLGISLPEQQVKEIVTLIQSGEETNILLPIGEGFSDSDSLASETGDTKKIELSEEDWREVMSHFSSAMQEEYPIMIDEVAKLVLNQILRESKTTIKENHKVRKSFEGRLRKRWKKALDSLELFISVALEAGAEFNETYRNEAVAENDLVFEVLTRLHARACQIASEVLTLIQSGFADGAHSRWRTLHEIAVVAIFISNHGREVAEQFLDHEFVEAHKAAVEHATYCAAMGHEPLADEEVAKIERLYQEVLTKYGSNFRHDYGWASAVLNNNRPTFRDIERHVGLDNWRPYYKMASQNVHAGAKGITYRLGLLGDQRQILLAGSTNTGFTDPAQGAAISLLQITVTLLTTRPNLDAFVRCEILKTMQDEIGKEFLRTQQSIEAEEMAVKHK